MRTRLAMATGYALAAAGCIYLAYRSGLHHAGVTFAVGGLALFFVAAAYASAFKPQNIDRFFKTPEAAKMMPLILLLLLMAVGAVIWAQGGE